MLFFRCKMDICHPQVKKRCLTLSRVLLTDRLKKRCRPIIKMGFVEQPVVAASFLSVSCSIPSSRNSVKALSRIILFVTLAFLDIFLSFPHPCLFVITYVIVFLVIIFVKDIAYISHKTAILCPG